MMFQNGALIAIDTDCVFQEEREGFTKLSLKKIVLGTTQHHEKIAKKLAVNLGSGVDVNLISSDRILVGMKKGIDKLLRFNQNLDHCEKVFVSSCNERGCAINEMPAHVKNFISFISSIKK